MSNVQNKKVGVAGRLMTRFSGYRDLAHEPKDLGSNPGTRWKKKT